MDSPLDNPDMEEFTDGSSFVRDGKRKAGYAVVPAQQLSLVAADRSHSFIMVFRLLTEVASLIAKHRLCRTRL